jgi:hypothetical protein
MLDEQGHLECEMEELRLEIKDNAERIDKLCDILKRNNEKLRTLKGMTNQTPCNHRTPPKYNVEYLDDKMVIVNGIQYQRVEEQKPQTLYEIIREWNDNEYCPTCEELVNRIGSEWLPNDDPHDGEEYQLGWNACLEYLRKKLK